MTTSLKSKIDGYIARLQKIQQDSTLDEGGKGLDDLLELADELGGAAHDVLYRGCSPTVRISDAETEMRWQEIGQQMRVLERISGALTEKNADRR